MGRAATAMRSVEGAPGIGGGLLGRSGGGGHGVVPDNGKRGLESSVLKP
jgi:hypothetical protein